MPAWFVFINWPRLLRGVVVAVAIQVMTEIVKVRRENGLA